MQAAYWFIVAGILLLSVVFGSRLLERLPLSVSAIYLAVGVLLGPLVFGLLPWEPVREGVIIQHLTEIAVIISLFTVGLRWRVSLRAELWSLPVRLATVGMVTTIAAVAMIGIFLLGLPLGAAVLLGAVLAPTDPVLASEVQVRDPTDRDPVRYALSGEAGLNDGLAFPFVMLGLGLLGLHPSSEAGFLNLWTGGEFGLLGWFGWDLVWAVAVGLAVGGLTGNLLGRAVVSLLRRGREMVALNEFLVLGSIALSYGLAELVYGYGFLSVFFAGYAFRHIELRAAGYAPEPKEMPRGEAQGDERAESDLTTIAPEQAAQRLASSLLEFNDQLERILEAAVVVVLGALLTTSLAPPALWFPEVLWLTPLLFLVVRPLSVTIALAGTAPSWSQRLLMSWFGIRGVGSIFYLSYAFGYGIPAELAERLSALVLSLVAVSIVVHGVSVTPVMQRYRAEA